MEQWILVGALALMALIAMSQCAHHSSRRHETSHLPPTRQHNVRAVGMSHQVAVVERAADGGAETEREATSGLAGTRR